jgi:protease I
MPNYYAIENVSPEKGEQVLILLAPQYNDMEFFYPYYRLIEEGYSVTVAGLEKGDCTGKNNYVFPVKFSVDEINPEAFDMVYVPGGKAPEALRKSSRVLDIVRYFADVKKPIVSICHGPLVLADADVLKGRRVTCWPEVKETVEKAGGIYEDTSVIQDNRILTSRWPADLPIFMENVLKMLH